MTIGESIAIAVASSSVLTSLWAAARFVRGIEARQDAADARMDAHEEGCDQRWAAHVKRTDERHSDNVDRLEEIRDDVKELSRTIMGRGR